MVILWPFPGSGNIILCTYKNHILTYFSCKKNLIKFVILVCKGKKGGVVHYPIVLIFFPIAEFFKLNTQYQYDYSVDISSAFAGVSESKSAARIVCGLTLEVPRMCEVAMKVNLHLFCNYRNVWKSLIHHQ